MARPYVDTSNAGNIANGLHTSAEAILVERDLTYVTIFEEVQDKFDINLLNEDPSMLNGISLDGSGAGVLPYAYRLSEMAKLGLDGEYNTLIGVQPKFLTEQYIEFLTGKEKAVEALGYDEILDRHRVADLKRNAQKGWMESLAKEKEEMYVEQVKNSAPVVKDIAGLQNLLITTGVGVAGDITSTSLATLTVSEVDLMMLAYSEYFKTLFGDKMPLLFVTPIQFRKIKAIPDFVPTGMLSDGSRFINEKNSGSIYGIQVATQSPKAIYAGMDYLFIMPGNVFFKENIIRPLKDYDTNLPGQREALDEGKVVYGRRFYGFTYESFVMIADNFSDQNTIHFAIVNIDGNLTQDPSLVLKGNVLGDEAPKVMTEFNRTLSEKIELTYSNPAVVLTSLGVAKGEMVEEKKVTKK